MLNRILMTLIVAVLLLPVVAFGVTSDHDEFGNAKPTKTIVGGGILPDDITVLSRDTVYVLDGLVYVGDGQILIIEPGTVVKGEDEGGFDASALVVSRGGKLYAVGTEAEPIIFTSVQDSVWDKSDLLFDASSRGLWGGVILLGIAPINDPAGFGQVEGIDPLEPLARYGVGDAGSQFQVADPEDNSGVLRYVSIRHGGTQIGDADEINGLTLGAVGCGTEIDYVEVAFNDDDGFEWFGGTVICNHLVSTYNKDDSFDYDEGFRGGGQFWFTVQTGYDGDSGGEHDGAGQQSGTPESVKPFAYPTISNVTYIGNVPSGSGQALTIRDNAAGAYYNSVFTGFRSRGIRAEFNTGQDTDTYQRILREQYKLYNNVWAEVGDGTSAAMAPVMDDPDTTGSGYNPPGASAASGGATDSWVEYMLFYAFDQANLTSELRCVGDTGSLAAPTGWPRVGTQDWKNFLTDMDIVAATGNLDGAGVPIPDGSLNPTLVNLDATFTNQSADDWTAQGGWADPFGAYPDGYDPEHYDAGTTCDEGFEGYGNCDHNLVAVDYPGAFAPADRGGLWICNWTALWDYGFIDQNACSLELCNCPSEEGKDIVPVDGFTEDFTHFSAKNIYRLDDLLFLSNNQTLYVEPGTIIKANTGTGFDAKALVVARGAEAYMLGASDCPIIMTSIEDIVDEVDDILFDAVSARGKWGGLIILGTAPINDPSGYGQVEGIDPLEPRARYGVGDGVFDPPADPADRSGYFKYVSVRHGGTQIGDADEINGVTLGAVGAGTVIDNVEVMFNDDDGFEFFGGTVRPTHLITAYCKDDSFDYDEGFRGGGQFWFTVQTGYDGDSGGEHDGAGQQSGTTEDVAPFATPVISNATYIGGAGKRALTIRDNAGSAYYNSVFAEFASQGVRLEFNESNENDSYQRLLREQVKLYNNVWGVPALAPDMDDPDTTTSGYNPVGGFVETVLFTTFDQSSLAGDLRGTIPATYPVTGHETQNWYNFATKTCAINNSGDKDGAGLPIANGTLDPRAANIDCTYLLDSANVSWSTWADPLAAFPVGYDPNTYDDTSAVVFPGSDPARVFDAVDYPGALDPTVPLDESWLTWSGTYCYGFIGENECTLPCDTTATSCCIGLRGNVDKSVDEIPGLGDLTVMIDHLFVSFADLPCWEEANVDGSSPEGSTSISLGDLTVLIDVLFVSFNDPIPCP